MSEGEATSDQDDVSFIRTDDMVCLQCSEIGERVCLAAEGFGNRHCFLEPIANKNYPPEMPSCVFVIEQALSVRALQEMITAESGDAKQLEMSSPGELGPGELGAGDELLASETGADTGGAVANQSSSTGLTGAGGGSGGSGSGKGAVGAAESGLGGGNRTLLYGHAVLLRHFHSGMYLATLSICSSSDKLAFDVGLKGNHEVGEFCWWTVHPGSKQRSEGEKVRVGDDLILVSVATERYLHYTTVENLSIIPPMASASAVQLAAHHQEQAQKQAIVNASFHSTHWSISPFGTGLSRVKNVGYVFGGQVLRLLHGGDECLTVSAQQTVTEVASPVQQQSSSQQMLMSTTTGQQHPHRERSNTATRQYTDVIYEGGAVMNQARSLWRLDLIRTRWSGGFVQYSNALRIRHITTGKYLGVNDQNQLCLVPKIEATVEKTAFCLKLTKDDSRGTKGSNESDDKDEEVIGAPTIKYGDSSFFIQHVYSQMWLSYRSYETKRRGLGRVEEKQAILSAEGKMDDCLEFSRSQEEEAKTARVIRKCDALFSRFIKILDHIQQIALMNKMTNNDLLGTGGSFTPGQESADGQQELRPMSKKRASLTASAVTAAALSSLAPIMTTMEQAGGHQKQPPSPTQSQTGQFTPGDYGKPDMDSFMRPSSLFPSESQHEMSKCLEDLIEYFAPPEEGCDHEQEQNTLRALRNRQDLFQEEGILNLILDAIDKINLISGQGLLILLLGEESSSTWDTITGYFYHLLAAIIKDNHTNCAQFAQSHRLNWLFSRLSSPQASEGTGMLDVLHFVLVDSPEALNMLKESHIKVLISLLEKHGRDPKVLNVLCSLCVSNGVAIRSSQNTITNHLLPSRDLLLQTRLVDHVASMRPNIYVAQVEGSAMYHRWYYEVVVDHIELINNLSPHLRVGWANTRGYHPYPGSGSQWGTNGVGDDFYSYGFDGQYLWTAGRPTLVRIPPVSTMTHQEMLSNHSIDYQNQHQALLESYAAQQNEFVSTSGGDAYNQQQQQQPAALPATSITNYDGLAHSTYLRLQKNDVIGCLIDLSIPTIQFTINGKQIFGFFKNFNVFNGGFFHPVISFSAKVSCRFLFGGSQGELYYRPPVGFSPIVDVLLPNQDISVESCFSFGDLAKQVICGPKISPDSVPQLVADLIFIPKVIDTYSIEISQNLESLRDSLAENMHELWCMSRIEEGWIFGEELDDHNRSHPYIAPFETLPALGKKYKIDLASQTLKIIIGLGYKIIKSQSQDQRGSATGTRVKTYRLPNNPYLQSNGYKPAPLDLVNHELTPKMNRLVELLAENIHNIWAAEKISLKWTYRRRDPINETGEEYNDGRSHHLLPYSYVDDEIKLKNRQTALETVFTILTYGFHIEFAPTENRLPLDSMSMPSMASGDNSEQLQMNNMMSVGTPVSCHTPNGLMLPRAPSRATSVSPGLVRNDNQSQIGELTGHEVLLNNARPVGIRHLRAEKTYAVYSGRWYYEVEVETLGHIQVGWANLNFQSNSAMLGSDENSWSFDCHSGRKVHASNYESFGQVASVDDVIGCMLDLNDRTISYSLNGKLLLDYLGNEIAFSYSDLQAPVGEVAGYVPAISLGANQRVRLSFGQDIENLKYFTDYGLQEGYQPFCVNMHKPITLWYNKREPNFVNIDDLDSSQVNIEVTRIPPGSDSPPALKIAYKSFESQERATWEYLRLSLPVTINSELIDESDKLARMQEIQAQHLRMAYSKVNDAPNSSSVIRALMDDPNSSHRHPARLEQHMLQSGFSIADIKDLQRSYDNHAPSSHSYSLSTTKQEAMMNQSSNIIQRQQQQQRRQQLVKTRSVDDASSVGPSLAVPSFTEAQRMMSIDNAGTSSKATLAKRRNTGFHLRGSVETKDHQQLIRDGGTGEAKSSKGSKSTIKQIFGSIKTRGSDTIRSRSLSRSANAEAGETGTDRNQLHLTIPKISIQNEQISAESNRRLPGFTVGNRSRSMSRSESYSNLSQTGTPSVHTEASDVASSSAGRGLVRRLSRVGLGSVSGSKFGGSKNSQVYNQTPLEEQVTTSEFETKFDLQNLSPASLELINEYHYAVRIFPGQEPSHVLCGWVSSHFKQENMCSSQDVQHVQIIQSTSLITGQAEICERRECYLLNAGQLYKEMQPKSSGDLSSTGNTSSSSNAAADTSGSSRTNRGMVIGCHIDTSTGLLSFTVDGKLTKHKFNLEPSTKLYPGIFFQATTGDCLQFELSNTPTTLPLSSAIFSLTSKHVQPQCPPRLKVQTLRSSSWARVPNVSLRPNSLKLPRGWSMLADDPLSMLVVHIPEENRCLDVLELIEHEKLLRFHSNTLTLYGALCAQGNHKVAHIICSHIDQRQLLYAINSDYLSGDLRRGFADLLIALHLEFHAYGRHLTQNEFIVPITNELCKLYCDSSEPESASLVHSFSRIECVSIRTELNMSPMGFDLNSIESSSAISNDEKNFLKMLSTPYFPINTLKRLVFQALDEAVYKGNLPIRDLPGGSNENLFVPLLKLADKLLLIGCVTNQELCWLLNLIDSDTFKKPKNEQNITNTNDDTYELAGLSFLATGAQVPSSTWKPTILQSSNSMVQKNSRQASKGLLQMRKLDEHVKLTVCHILHHLLDIQLRHRIESIMAFSVNFVGHLQTDQRRRYEEIKSSNLPSHLTAKKTREFRCSPREQMRYILNFKADSGGSSSSPSSEGLRNMLKSLHSSMMKQIKVIIEDGRDDADNLKESNDEGNQDHNFIAKRRLLDSANTASSSSIVFSSFKRLIKFVKLVKFTLTHPNSVINRQLLDQNGQLEDLLGSTGSQTELRFIKEIVKTVVKWAEESTIENKQLVREMFHLLLRCYNGVGELIEALNNSYVIGEKSKQDVIELLQVLSKVRALLAVQMGPAEEEVMRDCLWTLVNNVVFFQHPDLIRILRVHENVMHVMMNTLSKRSREAQSANPAVQTSSEVSANQQQQTTRGRAQSISGIQQQNRTSGVQQVEVVDGDEDEQEDDISKMVVSCCRFLCFFCRSSSKNQKAMFEHLGFLLENSNILLSRPSLRGSTPLDVAYSSLMENHELVLALRESYLEKIAIYLSRCGLQSNQELLDKGYPDVGWDPIEGERYLDFLRFCVWVNGESVEENSNLVIRLLIRRPECLGPALRGEGCGLFAAIKDAIAMADSINSQQMQERNSKYRQTSYGCEAGNEKGDDNEEDEDKINMGSAILNFYCALVDLLGRCAPESLTIGQGKHESIRARSILRSLVPLQDLKNAISLRFSLVNPQMVPILTNNSSDTTSTDSVSSFMPNHKQSLVLFLERVYGIEDQETFFSLLEEAFLPDMRAATMLERCIPPAKTSSSAANNGDNFNSATSSGDAIGDHSEPDDSENEMTLALNRYLGNSAIPLLIKESRYFKNAENYANLLEPTLHTIYRLSKVKILTKGQRESVSDFLIALTREMQPHQLLKLLRKLTVDVSVLNESTTVALKLLTLHYERCSKYYGYTGSAQTSASGVLGTATEEERRLTMVLFTNIFDSLSRIDYEPELFEDSLPCLNALACALPPDYSLTESREFSVKPKAKSTSSGKGNRNATSSPNSNLPQAVGPYVPQPVDTHGIELNADLKQMAKRFSEHYHDAWASRKLDRDWNYGEVYSFKNKVHPRLRPYSLLTQHERDRYIEPIEEAIKAIMAMGWTIDRAEHDGSRQTNTTTATLSRPTSRAELSIQTSASSSSLSPILDSKQKLELIQNYNPQPVDTSNLSLSRELQNLSERSAENAHDSWANKTIEDWQAKLRATANDLLRTPIMLHPLMVPYDLLTDREKKKNRERSQELLKYMLFEGYKVFRPDEIAYQQQQQQMSRSRINSRAGADLMLQAQDQLSESSKRRFAYSILTKLLAYTDTVMVKLELLKPSASFSRRSSFKQTDRDVKFFSKVVLPLIERYFTAHREFFVTYHGVGSSMSSSQTSSGGASPTGAVGSGAAQVDGAGNTEAGDTMQPASEGAGNQSRGIRCATVKEKEMLGTLFCKLAAILRNKLPVIGPDAKIFVRCLQVLTRALDARTLSESCPDFIKTSMLTYFSKTALDLSQCVFNLQMKRYNAVRGTTMRTNSSLYHVHLGILPTLTALFDHLASSETGRYLLIDDIQVSCQKILQSLYILGTHIQLAGTHNFTKRELIRHRQSYGNCLAAFAAAFPIAFLEPELVSYNRLSSMYTKRSPSSKTPAQHLSVQSAAIKSNLEQSKETSGLSSTSSQQASSMSSSSLDMPELPKLEELMKLVNKFASGESSGSGNSSGGSSRNNSSSVNMTGGGSGGGVGGGVASVVGQTNLGVGSPQLASSSSNIANVSSNSNLNINRYKTDKNSIRMVPTDNDAAIIEVIVPLLCSYTPFWFSQGPEASSVSARNQGIGQCCTNVVSKHLIDLLRDIMKLIRNHVGTEDGPNSSWLVTIAAHASQIIIDARDTSLLKDSFLPLSTKIVQRAESIYHREEVMRGYLKSMAEDTTAIEEKIQEEFHILVRDIYAFYPLLIRYADYKKSTWLKQTGKLAASINHQRNRQVRDTQSRVVSSNNNDSDLLYQQEEETQPEQLLFQHVATVFDIWSNSQYFRREEQNFISQHEIDNMALFMPASNRPGRVFFQKSDPIQSSSTGRRKNRRKQGEKRDRDKEIASSLLVVALKRLLPIGMNLFEGRERELIQHIKERFLKKDQQSRVEDIVRLQLTQPYQIDPSDEHCWQHHLYSRLGAQSQQTTRKSIRMEYDDDSSSSLIHKNNRSNGQVARVSNGFKSPSKPSFADSDSHQNNFQIDGKLVARIVDMARVFYGLHIIDHPNLQQKAGKKSCVSTQRRRVVIACFRMTSLHSLPRHRAINIFLKAYCDTWLLDESLGQEKLIEDLTQTFEQAEMKINQGNNLVPKNDPLCQLIMTLSRQATTEHAIIGGNQSGVDHLYLQFADIFRLSCGNDEEDEEAEDEGNEASSEEAGGDEQGALSNGTIGALDEGEEDEENSPKSEPGANSTIHEQEMEKQRLLFQQSRLSDRGVAEMILLYISAFSRYQSASGGALSGSGSGGGGGGSGAHNLSQHTPMILSTLKLGISILRGGNVEVQRRMLKHLKDKKDVGFFTSIQSLMSCCSVLDLDAFERNLKAEALGVRSEGAANEKNMYDAEFTCKLFRFFQLLCEGHNLEFQNYLRTQAGNTTTVNVVIATVDYLLRLQESIMDFYWHYSSKEVIDSSGIENFIKAITIAKQVFCTLTESIQGPCPQNQQALAHSRLWHAVGGFLFLFAHMQDKLSRNSSQLALLIELLDLQKEMVIMMLSMLEGNVVNGTIGKQMVETLVESAGNVEIILKFFDLFLKLPRLTSSTNFQEYDKTGSGWISLSDLKKAMEQHKIYTPEETQYLLSCCETNHDGMIDYREFIDRFHQPAKDIGFNLAVLLTNLAEHITNEPRLQRFLETASTVLSYFEPYLGRIEIMGSSKRIERVYFEIRESTLNQWAKPQIQESKRAFFYSIVTEGDGKEKLEAFVNFCEDTIFEMQHASKILGESEEEAPTKAAKYPFEAATGTSGVDPSAGSTSDSLRHSQEYSSRLNHKIIWHLTTTGFIYLFQVILSIYGSLQPTKVRRRINYMRRMSYRQMVFALIKFLFNICFRLLKLIFKGISSYSRLIFRIMTDGQIVSSEEELKSTTSRSPVGGSDSLLKKYLPRIEPKKSISSTSNGASSLVRTELITGPSIMTASVTDVLEDSVSKLGDATSASGKGSMEGSMTVEELQTGEMGQEVCASGGSYNECSDEGGYVVEMNLLDDNLTRATQRPSKSRGIANKLSQLTCYNQKIVSFLARNFYRIKLLALVTAFIINFILLFYKVSEWTSGDLHRSSYSITLLRGLQGSPSDNEEAEVESEVLRMSGTIDPASGLEAIEKKLGASLYKYGKLNRELEESEEEEEEGGGGEEEEGEVKRALRDFDVVDSEETTSEAAASDEDRNDVDEDGQGGENEEKTEDEEDGAGESTELVELVIIEEKYYYLQPILTILASVHSLFSLCMLIAYYHLKVPLVIFKREKEIARKLEFEGIYISEEPDSDNWWNGHWDKLVISAASFPVNYWDKFVKKRVREKYREQYDYELLSNLLGMDKNSSSSAAASSSTANRASSSSSATTRLASFLMGGWLQVDWRYQLWKAGVTLTDQSFQYQLLYLIFSLAGHFNYFFFAAHLLDVAVGFKKLQTILQSVTHNGKQLVLTVMLLTIVVYIYTVIAFNFFRKFYVQGDESADAKCNSMMTCFVYHLYQGVRAGGGIGDVIEAPDGDDYEVYRIIFDITFFFSVIIILLAIIQGLIIDAFGELRDQLLTVAADMESNCFICGIGKDVLDKVPRGFDTHVQKEHNLANYMFFLMHLINKPDTDYTGQETYVWELYQRRCWDFFPVGECFRSQSEEEADAKPAKD